MAVRRRLAIIVASTVGLIAPPAIVAGAADPAGAAPASTVLKTVLVTTAVMTDTTPPLAQMPVIPPKEAPAPDGEDAEPVPADTGHTADGALQDSAGALALPGPQLTFEGQANADNPFQVSPPDPDGDVGMHHYIEMVNLTFGVYSKTGQRLYGPATLGTIWQGFLPDCQDESGDPVVLYDKTANRWLLSQFTTRGPEFFNCVALSTTQDPLGTYTRYAFSTGPNFPDYPKYGTWPNGYYITTREFAPDDSFAGIGIYALDRRQMLGGSTTPRLVKFVLGPDPAFLSGDGLLAADLDGKRLPPSGSPEYFVGSMDDGADRGAPFDGLNLFTANIDWGKPASSTFALSKQLPIAPYDTLFPCSPGSRNCIVQPGTTNKVDILSYRQRPTWRLAYRNFGDHESLVTNQSVEARPGIAGVRWWEIRNPSNAVLYQEGTYAPDDGVNRWMGSIAMDKNGDIALGYSVSNATDVYPGIRYTGRLPSDPLGVMGQGEQVLINGSGSQTVSARWGDYTSMNVDPTDDCTFWYVNEYYQTSSARGWQTRIGSFKFPNCT
jgi:hypothetical protein